VSYPWTLPELERRFPGIAWTVPMAVSLSEAATRYACRVCIASQGLRGNEVDLLPTDPAVVVQHLKEHHR
jgi:hypothetical protein